MISAPDKNNSTSVIEELKSLSASIKEMRLEVSKLQNENSKNFEFSKAHDELLSVIESANIATNAILDSVEIIENAHSFFPPTLSSSLTSYINRMYESCSFQDISGQRIQKVINTINTIEKNLDEIFENYNSLLSQKESGNLTDEKKEKINFQIIRELYNLSLKLTQAKQDVASVQINKNSRHQFNAAKNELEEVARAASECTNTILSCAESIESMLDSVDNSKREELIQTVTHIYEACAFHDLIGQRITKVMKGLTHIDHALHKIFVGYLGENYDTEDTEIIPENAILENGPQLPKRAPTQDVIDAIFNSQSTS